MSDDTEGNIPDLAGPFTRDAGAMELLPPDPQLPAELPSGGQPLITHGPRTVTAQRVAVPRDLRRILHEVQVYCGMFGDTYVYGWEVFDRANNRKVWIEGGTIKLANDLVQLFGNCSVDVDVYETPTHWIFKAWFVDYEKGTQSNRLFQQRKAQNVGQKKGGHGRGMDEDRAMDMVFQIGQSKAIRNTVLNALASLTRYAIEESKKALIAKFNDQDNANKAITFIESVMERFNIDRVRIEAVVGRKWKDWTTRDLARVYMECRAITERMTVADDVYPPLDEATGILANKQAEADEGRKDDGRGDDKGDDKPKTTKPKSKPRTRGRKRAAAEPEPEQQQGETEKPAPDTAKPDNTAPEASEASEVDPDEIPAFLKRGKRSEPGTAAEAAAPTVNEETVEAAKHALASIITENDLDGYIDGVLAELEDDPATNAKIVGMAEARREELQQAAAHVQEAADEAEAQADDEGDLDSMFSQ